MRWLIDISSYDRNVVRRAVYVQHLLKPNAIFQAARLNVSKDNKNVL